MKCDQCGHGLVSGSRFCPQCGAKQGEAPPPRQTEVTVTQHVGEGSATGLKVDQLQADVVHIHVDSLSVDLIERLRDVRTELVPRGGERRLEIAGDRMQAVEEQGRELIRQVRAAETDGRHVEAVQAGPVRMSRVSLLLKEAVLLKTEADEMYFDQVRRHGESLGRSSAHAELDLGGLLADFDEAAHTAKLREALNLLEEANRQEPTNAEVLLHMAQVLDQLDEEPDATRRVLHRALRLLDSPTTDTDRLHLAQARFLLATSQEFMNETELRTARDLFAQIGRSDWVAHCDSLLEASAGVAMPGRAATPAAGGALSGEWRAHMSNGGTLVVALAPDGSLRGVQHMQMLGVQAQFNGQWQFDPGNAVLQLQGWVNGFTPFTLLIGVHEQRSDGFRGVGSDGIEYIFVRADAGF